MNKSTITKNADGNAYIMAFIAEDAEAVARGNGYNSASAEDALSRNGYAHTHVSAEVVLDYPSFDAESLGNAKENAKREPPGINSRDEYKDQHNNELGRRIGRWLKEWLQEEARQGRTYTEDQQEKMLDDLVRDADKSGDMIRDERTDDRTKNIDDQNVAPQYQNPKNDVTWDGPSENWKGASQPRDTSGGDDFNENPVGFVLDVPAYLAEAAKNLANKIFNNLDDLLRDLLWMDTGPSDIDGDGRPDGIFPVPRAPPPDWLGSPSGLFNDGPKAISPLVFDLDGDGLETTRLGVTGAVLNGDPASATYFDLTNDGFAERTGWVTGGDGLLALDRNNNGIIDNQSELFGNGRLDGTSGPYGNPEITDTDGFAALKLLDSNGDNKITAADAQFSSLRMWVDADEDGKTDAGELKTLASLKITSIDLNATTPLYQEDRFNNGNSISARSTFTMNGQTKTVHDVWFAYDNVNSGLTREFRL
jgi:hypothetical protein